jgi:hypothetical protein
MSASIEAMWRAIQSGQCRDVLSYDQPSRTVTIHRPSELRNRVLHAFPSVHRSRPMTYDEFRTRAAYWFEGDLPRRCPAEGPLVLTMRPDYYDSWGQVRPPPPSPPALV